MSSNGKEFSNDDFREMGEKLNTEITNTAAKAPWSNGINERHNAVLKDMIVKVRDDTKCPLDVAVTWAVSAKNALANVYGYSPNMLVFGRNPNFPSVLHDKLPALDHSTASKVLLDNLNAMHSARKAFIHAESRERIRRALKAKVRTSTALIFQNGDSVYYKREGVLVWKGPGVVIGKEGQTVLVKHGSIYVRVHPCRLKHANSEFLPTRDEVDETQAATEKIPTEQTHSRKVLSPAEEDDSYDDDDLSQHHDEVDNIADDRGVVDDSRDTQVRRIDDNQIGAEQVSSSRNDVTVDESQSNTTFTLPKAKMTVLAKTTDDVWKKYEVISRGGKVTGIYRDYVNVYDVNEKKASCVNWRDVTEWKEVEPQEILIASNDTPEIIEAKFQEIDKWIEYDVFDEVENQGQKAISVLWVCTKKDDKTKTRLVARGFEDDFSNRRTDSPTCSKTNLRLAIHDFGIHDAIGLSGANL